MVDAAEFFKKLASTPSPVPPTTPSPAPTPPPAPTPVRTSSAGPVPFTPPTREEIEMEQPLFTEPPTGFQTPQVFVPPSPEEIREEQRVRIARTPTPAAPMEEVVRVARVEPAAAPTPPPEPMAMPEPEIAADVSPDVMERAARLQPGSIFTAPGLGRFEVLEEGRVRKVSDAPLPIERESGTGKPIGDSLGFRQTPQGRVEDIRLSDGRVVSFNVDFNMDVPGAVSQAPSARAGGISEEQALATLGAESTFTTPEGERRRITAEGTTELIEAPVEVAPEVTEEEQFRQMSLLRKKEAGLEALESFGVQGGGSIITRGQQREIVGAEFLGASLTPQAASTAFVAGQIGIPGGLKVAPIVTGPPGPGEAVLRAGPPTGTGLTPTEVELGLEEKAQRERALQLQEQFGVKPLQDFSRELRVLGEGLVSRGKQESDLAREAAGAAAVGVGATGEFLAGVPALPLIAFEKITGRRAFEEDQPSPLDFGRPLTPQEIEKQTRGFREQISTPAGAVTFLGEPIVAGPVKAVTEQRAEFGAALFGASIFAGAGLGARATSVAAKAQVARLGGIGSRLQPVRPVIEVFPEQDIGLTLRGKPVGRARARVSIPEAKVRVGATEIPVKVGGEAQITTTTPLQEFRVGGKPISSEAFSRFIAVAGKEVIPIELKGFSARVTPPVRGDVIVRGPGIARPPLAQQTLLGPREPFVATGPRPTGFREFGFEVEQLRPPGQIRVSEGQLRFPIGEGRARTTAVSQPLGRSTTGRVSVITGEPILEKLTISARGVELPTRPDLAQVVTQRDFASIAGARVTPRQPLAQTYAKSRVRVFQLPGEAPPSEFFGVKIGKQPTTTLLEVPRAGAGGFTFTELAQQTLKPRVPRVTTADVQIVGEQATQAFGVARQAAIRQAAAIEISKPPVTRGFELVSGVTQPQFVTPRVAQPTDFQVPKLRQVPRERIAPFEAKPSVQERVSVPSQISDVSGIVQLQQPFQRQVVPPTTVEAVFPITRPSERREFAPVAQEAVIPLEAQRFQQVQVPIEVQQQRFDFGRPPADVFIPSVTPPPPIVFGGGLPLLPGFDSPRRRPRRPRAMRELGFQPGFTAVAVGLFGKEPEPGRIFTGLEVRPIPERFRRRPSRVSKRGLPIAPSPPRPPSLQRPRNELLGFVKPKKKKKKKRR